MATAMDLHERVDGWWAERLGCDPDVLGIQGVHVLAYPGHYAGAFALRRGGTTLLSVPDDLAELVSRVLAGRDPFDTGMLKELFGSAIEAIVGPTWIGYLEDTAFKPGDARGARRLDHGDVPFIWALADACDATEWEQSGISFESQGFGCFADGHLVAVGMLDDRGGGVREMGVITIPTWRGKGYGRAVASAAAGAGVADGGLVQYRTLSENAGSIRLAESLGFRPYGITLAVRLGDVALG